MQSLKVRDARGLLHRACETQNSLVLQSKRQVEADPKAAKSDDAVLTALPLQSQVTPMHAFTAKSGVTHCLATIHDLGSIRNPLPHTECPRLADKPHKNDHRALLLLSPPLCQSLSATHKIFHLPSSFLELASSLLVTAFSDHLHYLAHTLQLANHGVNLEESVPNTVLKYSMHTTSNFHPKQFVHAGILRGARIRRKLER